MNIKFSLFSLCTIQDVVNFHENNEFRYIIKYNNISNPNKNIVK